MPGGRLPAILLNPSNDSAVVSLKRIPAPSAGEIAMESYLGEAPFLRKSNPAMLLNL